jgi:hypothetical protein
MFFVAFFTKNSMVVSVFSATFKNPVKKLVLSAYYFWNTSFLQFQHHKNRKMTLRSVQKHDIGAKKSGDYGTEEISRFDRVDRKILGREWTRLENRMFSRNAIFDL